jgi:uncharacterized protein
MEPTTNILTEIVSAKTRAEIFRLFFGAEDLELHLREIERRTGFAIGTVKQETTKLVKTGLLQKRQDGNRTYFRADKSHTLYPDIHNMVLKSDGLADALRKALSGTIIPCAFIFDSIDGKAEKPKDGVGFFAIGDISLRALRILLKEPCTAMDREIHMYAMTEKEFITRKRRKEHFVSRVLQSPKIMIRGNEDVLNELGK